MQSYCRSQKLHCTLQLAATGRCERAAVLRAAELKHGCCVRSSSTNRPFRLKIAVAHRRAILRARQQCIRHRVEQLLRAAVAEMQYALAPDAIVDRKSHTD